MPVEPPAVPAEPDAAALRAALLALYRGIEDLVDVQDGGWRITDEASAAREHERWRDAWASARWLIEEHRAISLAARAAGTEAETR